MITALALGFLVLLLPPVLHDLIRRPTIRRLGIRNVVRRRGEAALVIGGSMLATALIVASFIVGSSFDQSIRNIAQTRLGPVDEVIFVDDADRIDELAAAVSASDDVDGVLPVINAAVAVGSVTEDPADRRVEPRVSLLELDIEAARAFGNDPESTGFAEATTGPIGTAIINSTLANDIGVEAGDSIDLFFGLDPVRLVVHQVVDANGIAGFAEIVVAPGSAQAALAGLPAAELQAVAPALLLVSNNGGVFGGADLSTDVEAFIADAAEQLGIEADSNPAKANLLEDAEDEGAEMTELFGTIGGFSVVAGILLVINLFVMLAGERTVELGTMRAVGLKRGTILRAFALEGALYGIVAAIVGALLGIVVGGGVIAFAARLFEGDGFEIALAVEPMDLVSGAAIGLAISQLTVVMTSFRMTRINIVRALKDLPPQATDGARWRRALIGAVGIAVGVGLFVAAPDNALAAMAGPVIAVVASIGILGLVIPRRLATVIGCGVAIVWPVLVFTARDQALNDPDIEVFLLQGILLVGLATVLLASLDRVWLGIAGALAPSGIASRLGLAHPLARPVRSALLVAMYALVIFTVTFMAVLSSAFKASAPELAQQAGGDYAILVDSNRTAPLTAEQLLDVEGVETVSAIRRGFVEIGPDDDLEGWGVSTINETWDSMLAPGLDEIASTFSSSEEAWDAVKRGADGDVWMMAPYDQGFEVGETVTLRSPSGVTADVRIAGTTRNGWLVNTWLVISDEMTTELWTNIRPVSRYFIDTADGVEEAVAAEIQGRWPEQGAEASTIRGRADDELQAQEGFLQMLQGYLGLGLLIGIAGLGVVLIRAVRERRRELGMLAAIGVPVRQTQRAFLIEASFIGIQGVLLGIGLGLISAWQILTRTTSFEEGLTFEVPVLWLLGLTVVAVGASMASAIVPARRAGKIPPAVALRVTG